MIYRIDDAFRGFSLVWTPVLLARDLATTPVAVCVSGTNVVLFRDVTGAAKALLDRCPHRGVKLSLGRVENGCLTCPFHGWRFDGSGACVRVPWHPDAKRELLSATALSTRELGGFVWIYTAPGVSPSTEPSLPSELLRDDVTLFGDTFTWRAHWTRAVENMVDDSHLPFVHPRTIGRGMQKHVDSRLSLDVDEHDWGFSWTVVIDGQRADWSSELRFPNVSLLRIPGPPGKRLGICFAAIPAEEGAVRILQLGYRDFATWRVFDPIFKWINRRVLLEDQAVVESSPPGPVPPPSEESSVATDVIGLRFRKRVLTELLRQGPSSPTPG
ncbi:MAG: aromatic ring-hydroxylating dioxygenase subunit alpha [Myxococcales bacterium]|nr:aromatic ring-hydroxylating dioxygenase subunit alpha [Myxococcales bacterium]